MRASWVSVSFFGRCWVLVSVLILLDRRESAVNVNLYRPRLGVG